MSIIQYLLAASIGICISYISLKLFFKNETNFRFLRLFILISIVLSFIIPLTNFQIKTLDINPLQQFELSINSTPIDTQPTADELATNEKQNIINYLENNWKLLLKIIYLATTCFLLYRTFSHILILGYHFLKSDKEIVDGFTIVYTDKYNYTFSFFNLIFIPKKLKQENELDKIIVHEKIHASQLHSIDLIMIELLSALMWFNPFIWKIRKDMQLVHEYLADEGALSTGIDRLKYQALLLNLVTEEKLVGISSGFNHSLIKKRMIMISKSKIKEKTKLQIFKIIPVAVIMFLGVAILNGQTSTKDAENNETVEKTADLSETNVSQNLKIGRIQWVGNTKFNDAILYKLVGLKVGDNYSKDDLYNRLWENETSIATLYFDNGYLFFNATIEETKMPSNMVKLIITITEGERVKFNQVKIEGNKKVPTNEILKAIKFKSGDWFSKTAIVNTIKALQKMGKFDPEKIIVAPTPNNSDMTVDILFQLVEL